MKKILLASGLLFFSLNAFALTDSVQASESSAFVSAQQAIPNFREIAPNVYRGANPVVDGRAAMAQLADLGVKTDVSFQGGDIDGKKISSVFNYLRETGEHPDNIIKEKNLAEQYNIKFISLPLDSREAFGPPQDRLINEALELMHKASPGNAVFIHCEHGADRTGIVSALYRIKYQGWTIPDARAEWYAAGHSKISRIFTGKMDPYFEAKARSFTDPEALKKYFDEQARD